MWLILGVLVDVPRFSRRLLRTIEERGRETSSSTH